MKSVVLINYNVRNLNLNINNHKKIIVTHVFLLRAKIAATK